jgi:hypothetical protein
VSGRVVILGFTILVCLFVGRSKIEKSARDHSLARCLGCTFRLSFRILGCRNPVQDSCSGRILAESGRNIPDVLPILRAGTLLPFWTGKRSGLFDRNPLMYMRRSFQLSACERKLFPATSKKRHRAQPSHTTSPAARIENTCYSITQ